MKSFVWSHYYKNHAVTIGLICLFIVLLTACSNQFKERQWIDSLIALEQSKHTNELGEPQAVIPFGVVTDGHEIFADGIVPWANPE